MSRNIEKIYIRDYIEDTLYEISLLGNVIARIIRFSGRNDLKGAELDFDDLPDRIQDNLLDYANGSQTSS